MDIDLMLNRDAKWLAMQTQRSVEEFLGVANKIELRQEDWASFWDLVGERLSLIISKEKMDKKYPKIHLVRIGDNMKKFNDEEMDFATFLLGQPEVEDGVYNFKFEKDE